MLPQTSPCKGIASVYRYLAAKITYINITWAEWWEHTQGNRAKIISVRLRWGRGLEPSVLGGVENDNHNVLGTLQRFLMICGDIQVSVDMT